MDLTDRIVKIQGQYLEGGRFGDVYKCQLKNASDIMEVAVKAFRFRLALEEERVDELTKVAVSAKPRTKIES
ncbi:hypothetical protein JVT61DRAFT_3512 [Boletus reticuloceps]|uniref:Uncharacterized protein n=1 Tax=Boletus reticuloceps TaxID=495285 RepID=A0A8I3AA99_9AGAM|nr:hypothetical protein JVT61DRAFT_3512 [Boletus reticuloceps]